jgi:hypothetical protein
MAVGELKLVKDLIDNKKKKNIVREIASRMIACLGHLEGMEEHQLSKKVTGWKPRAFRLRGRTKMM